MGKVLVFYFLVYLSKFGGIGSSIVIKLLCLNIKERVNFEVRGLRDIFINYR